MYTTVFWCRVHNDRQRQTVRRWLEATLFPLLPPDCDAVVAVLPEDPSHLQVVVTWADREECRRFLENNAFAAWKQEAAHAGLRLHGPVRPQRMA